MDKEKCSVCGGKPGDGYHKDPEEICSACNGTGEAKTSSKKPTKN
ncbi:MAG: hypothetical protein QQN41_00080 [Nitrosopumilus sp.]